MMEAKDTVMSTQEIQALLNKCDDIDSEEIVEDIFGEVLSRQAETSFKAGIREAVNWIKEHMAEGISYTNANTEKYELELYCDKVEWYTQLEEWGVN